MWTLKFYAYLSVYPTSVLCLGGDPVSVKLPWKFKIPPRLSKTQCKGARMEPTPISGGAGVLGLGLARFLKGCPTTHYPLCGCCAARSYFAEQHAHTALLSNVGQRFLDFYIAAAEQWLICIDRATSKRTGGGTVGCRECQNYLVCAWDAASLTETLDVVLNNWYSVLPLSF